VVELYSPDTSAAGVNGDLDLSGNAAITNLVIDGAVSTTNDILIGAAVKTTIRNQANGDAVHVESTATDTTHDITITNLGTIAGAGVTINADGAAVTTINLTATGTVAATTDSDVILASTGTETTVNVSGSGDLALTTAASVTTINAADYSGNITIADHTPTAATTITTAGGNDTITAAAAVNYTISSGAGDDVIITGNLNVNDSINGGAGTDTLGLSEANIDTIDADTDAAAAIRAKLVGFEILRATDDLDGTALDLTLFGINSFQMAAATTADTTVSGFTSGATVEKRDVTADAANAAIVVSMTGATAAGTTSDTLNIKLNANLTATETVGAAVAGTALLAAGTLVTGNFDIAGINIVNVSTSDLDNSDAATDRNDGYILDIEDNAAGSNSASLQTLNISGSSALRYAVEAESTGLATINGSTATGDLQINADAFAGLQGLAITGGTGTNRLVGTDLGDLIVGGARADFIDGGMGSDVLTGGAGADTFYFAAEATASTDNGGAPSATVFDTITDFEKGTDLIALHDDNATIASEVNVTAAIVANAAAAIATVASISATGICSFAAADDTLAEKITAAEGGIQTGAAAAGQFAVFQHGSDSYVFVSDGTDGVDANDVLIKLTGVTGLTTAVVDASGDISLS
jgi:hypothetical protein